MDDKFKKIPDEFFDLEHAADLVFGLIMNTDIPNLGADSPPATLEKRKKT